MGTHAMKTGMLDGYKVLDLTQALAGPTATRYLGQMGAQVIKLRSRLTAISPVPYPFA